MGSGALSGSEREQGRGWFAAALVAGFVAAFAAGGQGCSSDPTDANRPLPVAAVAGPDGGTYCVQPGATCTPGSSCVQGNCTATCTDGGPCPTGSYCEGAQAPYAVCSAVTPITCTTSFECPSPQVCSNGMCTVLELRADGGNQGCVIGASGNDGCAPDALCYQTTQSGALVNRCVGLAHCGVDGGCPIGAVGSTCNQMADGGLLFTGKQRLCLFSFCVGGSDCPSLSVYGQGACFHTNLADPLGQCQWGRAGDYCYSNGDCFNAASCGTADGGGLDAGELGFCR